MDELDQAAFEISKLLYGQGLIHNPLESLSARILGIQKGLSAEAEFAATVTWLGNCDAIFRIETNPTTIRAGSGLRAPDFIAFPSVKGRATPVLIEVKARAHEHLKWSEKYLSSLTGFAKLLNLPLLVAWKYKGLWLLVDHSHFDKNVTAFRLTIQKAVKEDLMSLLFRDLRVALNPKLQMYIDFEILDATVPAAEDAVPDEFDAKIVNVGYAHEGIRLERNKREYFYLQLSAPDEVQLVRNGERRVRQIFRPTENTLFSLSRALITELSLGRDKPDWHDLLRRGSFPGSGTNYRRLLPEAVEDGVVLRWFDIEPSTTPSFL